MSYGFQLMSPSAFDLLYSRCDLRQYCGELEGSRFRIKGMPAASTIEIFAKDGRSIKGRVTDITDTDFEIEILDIHGKI